MIRTGLTIAALALAQVAVAQPAPGTAIQPANDYTLDTNWLCRPGRADVCSAALDVATVAANGKVTVAALPTAVSPKIDCFYVYPTVSTDPGGNSDMTADPAEKNVAKIQFAAFRGVCRTFAPMYRQVTLAALRAMMTGQASTADRVLAYADVADAWHDYLARDNNGRGVVLIGHSQGSGLLKALIAREIDGKPVAAKVIGAYLMGTNVNVPAGKDVGGDFKTMPLCHSASQVGCVVTYVSFRDDKVPPVDSRFGRTTEPGMAIACTNPAALGGGRGALKALLPNADAIVTDAAAQPAWTKGFNSKAAFVAVPGLLSAECRSTDGASYLAVRTDADPADPRTDQIAGDVFAGGKIRPEWGLHLIDVNEALGNLVALAASQGAAYTAKH